MEAAPLDLSKTSSATPNQSLMNDSGLGSAEHSYDWTEVMTDQPLDLTTKKGFNLAQELSQQSDQTKHLISSLHGLGNRSDNQASSDALHCSLQDVPRHVQANNTRSSAIPTIPKTAHSHQSHSLWNMMPYHVPAPSTGISSKRNVVSSAMASPIPIFPKLPLPPKPFPPGGIYTGCSAQAQCFTSGSTVRAGNLEQGKAEIEQTLLNRPTIPDHLLASENPYFPPASTFNLQGIPDLPYYNNRSGMPYPSVEMCHAMMPRPSYDYLNVPLTKVNGLLTPTTSGIFDADPEGIHSAGVDMKGGFHGNRLKTSLHYMNPFNRKNLNFVATKVLHEWFSAHIEYPYPSNEEVHLLARAGNVTEVQVRKWLANRRLRTGNTFRYAYSRKRHQFGSLKQSARDYLPSSIPPPNFTGNENHAWISPKTFRNENPEDVKLETDL